MTMGALIVDDCRFMVTAEGEKENILRALSAGADESLMKPFDREARSEKLALLGGEEE